MVPETCMLSVSRQYSYSQLRGQFNIQCGSMVLLLSQRESAGRMWSLPEILHQQQLPPWVSTPPRSQWLPHNCGDSNFILKIANCGMPRITNKHCLKNSILVICASVIQLLSWHESENMEISLLCIQINILANRVHSSGVLFPDGNSCHSRGPFISFPTDTQMNQSIAPSWCPISVGIRPGSA